jgi:hypothetical protein
MPLMAAALLFIFYCFEAGLFFLAVPWTRFWVSNPLLQSSEMLSAITMNGFFRGFVSGFGAIHLIVGIRELMRLFGRDDEGPV